MDGVDDNRLDRCNPVIYETWVILDGRSPESGGGGGGGILRSLVLWTGYLSSDEWMDGWMEGCGANIRKKFWVMLVRYTSYCRAWASVFFFQLWIQRLCGVVRN